ncbi:MAG: C2H2-type zinc finger protein [Promethearchaeota archaeon]
MTKYKFKCSDCDKAFASQEALDQHMNSKHKDNAQGKKSSNIDSEKGKPSETSKVKCPYCGKLRSKKGLKEHVANTHEIPCPYCSERISSQNSLLKHIEGSHKEKIFTSFICHPCKKVFKSEDALFQHMRLKGHHLESTESLICPQCNKEFRTRGMYLDHLIQTKHNLVHPPNWDDNFSCPICDKEFTSSKSLTQHISVKHTESQKEITVNKGGIAVFERPSFKGHVRNIAKKIIPKSLPDRDVVVMDESVGRDSNVKDALNELYDVISLLKKFEGKTPLEIRLLCKDNEYGIISKDYEMVKRAQEMKLKPLFLLSERGKHRDILRISKRNYVFS